MSSWRLYTIAILLPLLLAIIAMFLLRQQREIQEESEDTLHFGSVRVINQTPHDSNAFTQGLTYFKDPSDDTEWFYESVGLYGKSQIRKVNLETGKVMKRARINEGYFGTYRYHT
jgi:glutamine cyclotransferase